MPRTVLMRELMGLTAVCLAAMASARATELSAVYQAALTQDAQVRSARQSVDAAQARVDQANGGLWPQLNLTANTSRSQQHLSYDGELLPDRRDRYSANGYNLQLTQALFRREDMARREAARMAVEQARAQAEAAEQALLVRVVQPWYEACQYDYLAQAGTLDAQHQKSRWEGLSKRLARGDVAPHEVAIAQANWRLAQAKLAEAEAERHQRLFVLSDLSGLALKMPDLACRADSSNESDDVLPLQAWLDAANEHSPEVQAARMAVKVAQAQLRQAVGAQSPTLDAVASNSLNKQGPTASLNVGNRARTESVGLQLNLPLFAGGTLSAREREAVALVGKAESDLEATQSKLRQDVSSNWHSLVVAMAHGQAATQKWAAMAAQHEAVSDQVAHGQAIEADEQNAAQELAAAQADLVRLRGLTLLARVKLTAQAGLDWQTWPVPLQSAP